MENTTQHHCNHVKSDNAVLKWQIISGVLVFLLLSVILFDVKFSPRFAASPDRAPESTSQASVQPLTEIIPTGIPAVYGAELGVSYNDVKPGNPRLADQTIEKLAQFDLELKLEGKNLERYINILYKLHGGMSCEYCCDAPSIIFKNGEPACGCAHSYAMRGLAKYLILNYEGEMTDEEILEEIGKWKVLFFPEIHAQKAAIMRQKGMELNYVDLTANVNRGIEQGAGSGMVGGC